MPASPSHARWKLPSSRSGATLFASTRQISLKIGGQLRFLAQRLLASAPVRPSVGERNYAYLTRATNRVVLVTENPHEDACFDHHSRSCNRIHSTCFCR